MGMKEDLEQLFQRIRSGDRNLRRGDFELLSDLSRPELSEFSAAWAGAPAEVRVGLISALAQMASESFEYSFERIFKALLDDPEPLVRAAAIRGLWECEDERLAGRLLHLLKRDPAIEVRAAAAAGLGPFVYLGELEELATAIAADIERTLLAIAGDPAQPLAVRRRAIEALGFSSSAEVARAVRDAYEEGDLDLRASALVAMGRSADRRWRKIVVHELESRDSQVRLEAARACGELELREAVLPLARLIEQDANLKVRQAAVGALGRAGGPTAKKMLDLLLDTEEGPLYEAAQDAMEELNFAAECPEISDLLYAVDEEEEELLDVLEEPAGLYEDDFFEDEDDRDEDEDEDWEEDDEDFLTHEDAEDEEGDEDDSPVVA